MQLTAHFSEKYKPTFEAPEWATHVGYDYVFGTVTVFDDDPSDHEAFGVSNVTKRCNVGKIPFKHRWKWVFHLVEVQEIHVHE